MEKTLLKLIAAPFWSCFNLIILKKSTLKPLTISKPYVKFNKSRNIALEKLLHVHLTAIDKIIGKTKSKIMAQIEQGNIAQVFRVYGTGLIQSELHLAAFQITEIVKRLRAETYLLAHTSEAEAIGRALGKVMKSNPKVKAHKDKPTYDGGDLLKRMNLSFNRLGRKIQDALQLSYLLNQDPKERVERAFPPTRDVSSTPALHKRKMKEAARGPQDYPTEDENDLGFDDSEDTMMSTGVADQSMWDDIVTDYTSDQLPSDIFARGPQDKTLFYDVDELGQYGVTERYTWEVEQEITEDFVRSVRSGEQDAANENGITDFMWIAVEDGKTDECCSERDGKSSSQIEDDLSNGKLNADDSDAIVAPAHFNCATKGHMIETIDGQKLIEHIDIGDQVLTHTGNFKSVTRCLRHQVVETIDMELSDGRKIRITSDHPLFQNGKWISAGDLREGDFVTSID